MCKMTYEKFLQLLRNDKILSGHEGVGHVKHQIKKQPNQNGQGGSIKKTWNEVSKRTQKHTRSICQFGTAVGIVFFSYANIVMAKEKSSNVKKIIQPLLCGKILANLMTIVRIAEMKLMENMEYMKNVIQRNMGRCPMRNRGMTNRCSRSYMTYCMAMIKGPSQLNITIMGMRPWPKPLRSASEW